MAPAKKQRKKAQAEHAAPARKKSKKGERELGRKATTPPVFSTEESDRWLPYLQKHGYVAIQAIDTTEVKRLTDLFWKDMKKISPNARPSNVTNKVWPGLFTVGIVKDHATGCGQSEFAWECRNLDSVKNAFAKIHDCSVSDLASSFDSFGVFRNPALDPKYKTSNGWIHVDQGTAVKDWCVQGLLNLIEANEETGGFVCLPGSHTDGSHTDLMETVKPTPSNNFIKVPEDHDLWYKVYSFLKIPAGCLLLWDSKLVHSNTHYLRPPEQPKKSDDATTAALSRLVCYICMVPRKRITEEVRQFREQCVEGGRTTNHWPDRPKAERLPYPRHTSFDRLHSCALPPSVIKERYGPLI